MIYVDDAFIPAKVGRLDTRWCHMMTDEPDLGELLAMADKIGLKREWLQDGTGLFPHFDVTPVMRQKALSNGAVAISWRVIGEKWIERNRRKGATKS